MIFNKTLNERIKYLIKIFNFFEQMNIAIKLNKMYFNYSSIILLNQKINSFEFINAKKKLNIILKFRFFIILKLLKYYLKFIK